MKMTDAMVYICSPYRGDVLNNTKKAQRICRKVSSMNLLPLAPHLYFPQFLDDNDAKERELGINLALDSMHLCTEVWVFGDEISSGMKTEISHASKLGKIIRFFNSEDDI